MMVNPKVGQAVLIHYGPKWLNQVRSGLQDRRAVVEVVGAGSPRNHLVNVGGERVVVPAGNLNKGA